MKSSAEKESFGHPAQKPLELMSDIVKHCSNEGDVVLDPYAGSGTTCLAAKTLLRNYIGIDTSEEYCKTARNRT